LNYVENEDYREIDNDILFCFRKGTKNQIQIMEKKIIQNFKQRKQIEKTDITEQKDIILQGTVGLHDNGEDGIVGVTGVEELTSDEIEEVRPHEERQGHDVEEVENK
jgi:hypothetical protein